MAKKRPAKKPKLSPCQQRSQDRLDNALDDSNAQFHKALEHNSAGEVNSGQFRYFISQLSRLNSDRTVAKDGYQLRRKVDDNLRQFVNPQAGWAFDSELSDPCCFQIPLAPALTSEFAAAEMIEDYWMAVLRDVPFTDWSCCTEIASAASELSEYKMFVNGANPNADPNSKGGGFQSINLTHKSVFRGGELKRFSDPSAGVSEDVGPYISQFLLHEIPYGTLRIPQKNIYAAPDTNYMIEWGEWLAVQNGERRDPNQNLIGARPGQADERRFLSTMRDLATYVHFDQLYQAYLNAALILLGNGYPVNQGNPYGPGCSALGDGQSQSEAYTKQVQDFCKKMDIQPHCAPLYPDQEGFGTLGGPHVLSLVTEVATRALKAVWRQKWTLLRLRPEAYGGLVERALGSAQTPYNGFPRDVMQMLSNSEAINRVRHDTQCSRWNSQGSALLPMAFPEGSPTHPAYGAGHATVAGACVTVLKAFFNGCAQFTNPVQASACGRELVPYCESDSDEMTVELELNKLAANISIGRDMAGVHWRSDYTQSVLLGQRVAIDMLYRQKDTYTETWAYLFNSFGGKPVRVDETGVYCGGGCHANRDDAEMSFCGVASDCTLADFLLKVI